MNTKHQNSMQGNNCLITGSSRGIGYFTALGLAQKGAHVIIVAQNQNRCQKAVSEINRTVGREDAAIAYPADLSSQKQIHQLADFVNGSYSHLDVLINNVGGWFKNYQETEDHIEKTFALNHLSYFLVTGLLLKLILNSPPARIINVSSDAHRQMKTMQFEDIQFKQKYRVFSSYAQSKLANLLFTNFLANQLKDTGVSVNALHPGLVVTDLYREFGVMTPLIKLIAKIFGKSPQKGAETPIYLARSIEVANFTGSYFIDKTSKISSQASYDLNAAERLWKLSEVMTQFTYPLL